MSPRLSAATKARSREQTRFAVERVGDVMTIAAPVKRHKFGAIRTEVDGVWFASKKEARRYSELRLLERAGEITELALQPRFPIRINGQLVTTYVADFIYVDKRIPATVIEDVKGMKTPIYRLKAKLMLAVHGIQIAEV